MITENDMYDVDNVEYNEYTLFEKKRPNYAKRIFIYVDDDDLFQVDYNITYNNGTFADGNCFVELNQLLNKYNLSYTLFKKHIINSYKGDEDAFNKIIDELIAHGLTPNVDESKGGYSSGGFFMSNI